MRLNMKNYQWIKFHVYESIFGEKTQQIIPKYRTQLTTEFEKSVIKPNNLLYNQKPYYHY